MDVLSISNLDIEYCAFMVAIVIIRHRIMPETNSTKKFSAADLATEVNAYPHGDLPSLCVAVVALEHGLKISRSKWSWGIT